MRLPLCWIPDGPWGPRVQCLVSGVTCTVGICRFRAMPSPLEGRSAGVLRGWQSGCPWAVSTGPCVLPSCQLTRCRGALSRCRRTDVLVLTPWLAPIIWEGTFNIDILNTQFRLQNVTVGLTVFAIKK